MFRWVRRVWLGSKLRHAKQSWVQISLVRELAQTGDPAAARYLIPLLAGPDRKLSEVAAWCLGELHNPAAGPRLIPLLAEPAGELAASAAWALGRLGDPMAIPHLVAAMSSPKGQVRRNAAESLEKLGWVPPDSGMELRWHVAAARYEKAAEAGSAAFPALRDEFRLWLNGEDSHWDAKPLVAALGRVGVSDAVPHLLEGLLLYEREDGPSASALAKSCADALALIDARWTTTNAANRAVNGVIVRLERGIHKQHEFGGQKPFFHAAWKFLSFFPDTRPAIRAWFHICQGGSSSIDLLKAGGPPLFRPLLAALYTFDRDKAVEVLDATIPGWWELPAVKTLTEVWTEGLKGQDWEKYVELLTAARDGRGAGRLLDEIRSYPTAAAFHLRRLTDILVRAARHVPENCLRAVTMLDDEYYIEGRTHVGFRIGDYPNEEIPDYEEYKNTYDFRPVKLLAAAEIAQRTGQCRP